MSIVAVATIVLASMETTSVRRECGFAEQQRKERSLVYPPVLICALHHRAGS